MLKEIKNSTSKVWTKAELKETCKQAKEAKLSIKKDGDMTEITDPATGLVVLRALNYGAAQIVRYDQSYFDGSRKLVYVYVDKNLYVCYCCDQDSEQNRRNSGWNRFEVPQKYVQEFFNYYQLKFHPYTRRTV
jgi:hypothetical protein